MRIVHKYGGTSLGDGDRIRRAAERVAALAREGHQMIVVVSAQGDTTDRLLEDTLGANTREKDAYIALGELLSAGKMAMMLESLGCPTAKSSFHFRFFIWVNVLNVVYSIEVCTE